MKKSINTRGIINELEELSNTEQLSTPIKTIFGNKEFAKSLQNEAFGHTSAILSNAQANIISNSEKFPFTTIVGPLGTGKTYTIAALAIDKMSRGKSVLIVSKTDKAEVFNVVITRACKQQCMVDSIDTQALKTDSLLIKYI